MKKFELPKEKKQLLEPFEFVLNNKTFKCTHITDRFVNLLSKLGDSVDTQDPTEESKILPLLLCELMGEDNWKKNKPFHYYEVTALIKWISEEILNPLFELDKLEEEEKNE